MHVTAIHTIHDPAGFKKREAEALKKGIPSEFKLPIQGATNDHSKEICVWEGPSVKAVQELVDSVVGPGNRLGPTATWENPDSRTHGSERDENFVRSHIKTLDRGPSANIQEKRMQGRKICVSS
jgi:hypothetical protein